MFEDESPSFESKSSFFFVLADYDKKDIGKNLMEHS